MPKMLFLNIHSHTKRMLSTSAAAKDAVLMAKNNIESLKNQVISNSAKACDSEILNYQILETGMSVEYISDSIIMAVSERTKTLITFLKLELLKDASSKALKDPNAGLSSTLKDASIMLNKALNETKNSLSKAMRR